VADTSARMLRLLSLLQLHRHWPGAELAERLEVSERTVRRDIDRLRALGYPVESLPGVAGGYQMGVGSSLPPMVFDDEEAIALAIGLRDVAHGSDPSTAEASLRALAKLTAMLPGSVRRQLELVSSVTDENPFVRRLPTPDVSTLGAIAQACRDGVRLRFDYTSGREDPSHRYVEPYRLVTRGRRWYLVAFDLDRNDWRTFRVDRARDPQPSKNSFDPRELPSTDLPAYISARIRDLRPTIEVEVVVEAPIERVAAKVGRWAEVTVGPRPSTSRVRMQAESFDWPSTMLAGLDADFTIVKPAEFHDLLRRFAARIDRAAGTVTRSANP
jgi:predicted DNA-binding transcriptional regulator YafY